MSNIVTNKPKFSVAIKTEAYQNLINNTLGDKEVARRFVADISSVVSNNAMLASCEAGSILSAGLTAQSLKLPLAQTLGYAYIVPYKEKAQLQIGYKGFVQLAMRTGQYQRIGTREVHEGEYKGQDKFGDDLFEFNHQFDSKPIVGYYAYFVLNNGFEKSLYWTRENVEKHARKYSRSYASTKETNLWRDSFDEMALKTVLKQLLAKWGPVAVEMEQAIKYDQAVMNSDGSFVYEDNPATPTEDMPKKKTNVNNTIIEETAEEVMEENNDLPTSADEYF